MFFPKTFGFDSRPFLHPHFHVVRHLLSSINHDHDLSSPFFVSVPCPLAMGAIPISNSHLP
jgi:hypothetical protein